MLMRITKSNYVLYKNIIEKITKKMEEKPLVLLLEENSNDASPRNTYIINT